MTPPVKPLHAQLFLLLLLLALCSLIYLPGLQGPMLLDDYPQLGGLLESDTRDWDTLSANHLFSTSGNFGRPVSMASFIANAVLHGDDLVSWKATNLLIHLVTAVVVFFLARVLLQAAAPAASRPAQAGWLALLVAGLWLLHALHVSTVLYTVQRMAQLATLFTLAGLLAYAWGRYRQVTAAGHGWGPISAAYLLCLPLAVLSKESGVLLLLLIPLLELVVFRGAGVPVSGARTRQVLLAAMLLPLLLGVLYLLLNFEHYVLSGYATREFSLEERTLTQPRVLVSYLHQLLVPLPGLMGFYHDDVVVSTGLLEPVTTGASLLLLAGLLGLAWWTRRRQPLVTLGILFFFLSHVLESTVFPLELMFEHRNYLASFGIMLLIAVALAQAIRQPRVLASAGIVLLLVWSSLTVVRAGIWGSTTMLLGHMYSVHPDSRRLAVIHANSHADAGDYPRALSVLERFEAPGFRVNRLHVLCLRDRRIADDDLVAVTGSMQGVMTSHAMTGLIRIANLGLDGACDFSASLYLGLMDRAAAMQIGPLQLQRLHLYRAHYLHRLAGVDGAMPALEAAFLAGGDNPVPLFLATEWLLDAGQVGRAGEVYDRALRVASASSMDYSGFTESIGARLASASE